MIDVEDPKPAILIVYQHLPHYRLGVFEYLQASQLYRVDFAAGDTSSDGNIPSVATEALKRVHPLRNVWIGKFLWQRGLIRHLQRHKYEQVVFLGDVRYLSTWIAMHLARKRGVAVNLWTIGWHRPEKGLKSLVRRLFYGRADRLLLYGEDARLIGLEAGFPAEKMAVIGNSQHIPPVTADMESSWERPTSRNLLVLGAAARLRGEKRLDMAVQAAARLAAEGRATKLVLLGEGPERAALARLSNELGVEIEFLGETYDADGIANFYKEIDITVVPERAGLTVMQSLSHGVPVITVNDPHRQVPEFRAVVPGVTGGLYSPDDVQDLARAIESLAQKLDRSRTAVAHACRAEIDANWSPAAHGERILAALGETDPVK